jgi:hypothetical protein
MTYVIIEYLAQLVMIIYTVIAAIIRISTKAMPVKCHPKKNGVHSQFSTNCIIKNTKLKTVQFCTGIEINRID